MKRSFSIIPSSDGGHFSGTIHPELQVGPHGGKNQKLMEAINGALDHIDLRSLIATIEKGIEIEKLQSEIEKDNRTYDAEVLLQFLYMRRIGEV